MKNKWKIIIAIGEILIGSLFVFNRLFRNSAYYIGILGIILIVLGIKDLYKLRKGEE